MNTEQLAIYIGEKIRIYRKQKGWTQQELGKEIGMSKNAIGNYEKGFRSPKKDTLFKLANAFDISIDDLFPPIKKSDIDSTFKDSQPTNPQVEVIPSTLQKITATSSELEHKRQLTVLNFAENELTEQNAERMVADNAVPLDDYRKRVPEVVDFAASAGTGVCQEDNLGMEVMFYEDELAEDYDSIGIVMGSSMEPVLKNGDYLFVKMTSDIPNGSISIWQVNGDNYVKKFRNNGRPYLESLNPEFDDIDLEEDDDIRPLGIVVDVYRES